MLGRSITVALLLSLAPRQRHLAYLHLGDRVWGDERGARRGRPPSWAVAAILAAGLSGWTALRLSMPLRTCRRTSAIRDPAGRATKPACSISHCPVRARIRAGPDAVGAAVPFKHRCRLRFIAACDNLRTMLTGGVLAVAPPTIGDYPIVLREQRANHRPSRPPCTPPATRLARCVRRSSSR
jgi:hypothetical protein